MNGVRQINLSQVSELFKDGRNDELESYYISQNLLVVRNPPIAAMMPQLVGDTYLLPEMRVMVIVRGHLDVTVNLTPQRFEAGQLIFLSQNSLMHPQSCSADLMGFGLSLSNELASLAFSSGVPQTFDGHVRHCCLPLTAAELQQVEALHTLLYSMTHDQEASPQVVLHLVSAFLWLVDGLCSHHEHESRSALSREQRLFTDFVQLVSQYAPPSGSSCRHAT